MTKVRDFVVALARAGKSYTETKTWLIQLFGASHCQKAQFTRSSTKLRPGKAPKISGI
jgi:hypothetical protein